MTKGISAYIPCFNNRETLAASITGIREQTRQVDELFVIDDGSSDDSAELCRSLNVRVVRHENNRGRGAARARAMLEASNELVLCCDATNRLAADFVEKALPWFDKSNVAAAFGRISQKQSSSPVDRWRGIYLFNERQEYCVRHQAGLITYGAIVRKSHTLAAGNYNASLRHSEDGELGGRLIATGFDVISDPSLLVISVASNTLGDVLERYWRWHAGKEEKVSLGAYLKDVIYSLKEMVWNDLREKDLKRAIISFVCPHYQFWRSWLRHLRQAKNGG